MICLADLLGLSGVSFNATKTKVHLARHNGREHPIDVYFAGDFAAWQGSQSKKNFECDQVVSLIDLGRHEWLFVGLYRVVGSASHPQSADRILYDLRLVEGVDELIGRVVVHHQAGRASYIWLKNDVPLPVSELRREAMAVADFPGFRNVLISGRTLRTLVSQQVPGWKAALSSVQGIYLIRDPSTGRQYVGKASGESGIWGRWCDYAATSHGGNVKMIELLDGEETFYSDSFQFSVLEVIDLQASEKEVLQRESHWMKALGTREYGLN